MFLPRDVNEDAQVEFQRQIEQCGCRLVIDAQAIDTEGARLREICRQARALGEILTAAVRCEWTIGQSLQQPALTGKLEELAGSTDARAGCTRAVAAVAHLCNRRPFRRGCQ